MAKSVTTFTIAKYAYRVTEKKSAINVYFQEMNACSLDWLLFCLLESVSYFKRFLGRVFLFAVCVVVVVFSFGKDRENYAWTKVILNVSFCILFNYLLNIRTCLPNRLSKLFFLIIILEILTSGWKGKKVFLILKYTRYSFFFSYLFFLKAYHPLLV